VYSITAAPDGALWFDYLDGVPRYDVDGEAWNTYPASGILAESRDVVSSLTIAPTGEV